MKSLRFAKHAQIRHGALLVKRRIATVVVVVWGGGGDWAGGKVKSGA